MQKTKKILLIIAAVLISCFASASARPQSAPFSGQSSTLLSDGRVLLLGGFDSHGVAVNDSLLVNVSDKAAQKLEAGLNFARAGHSATVLPDGTVFIFGGLGTDGQVVSAAELFDPATQKFSPLADVLAVPRAFHTATLLSDGQLLLAGGVLAAGEFPDDVQLWDFRTRQALSHHALLSIPREGHAAVLLADGNVRISGGTDRFGRPVKNDEIYDRTSKRFRFANSADPELGQSETRAVQIAESIPEDRSTGVSIQAFIALRFTRLLNVTLANGGNFVLVAPNNAAIEAKVTAAERGRLVFVLPVAPLQTGTTYTLRIKGAADAEGAELAETSITFTTEGQPATSGDMDGAGAGVGGANTIATFQQLPPLQAAPGETALAGQVLSLNGRPLEHVTLEMDGQKTRTDDTGRFLLKDLKPGHHVLWIDGATANHGNTTYGLYQVGVTISDKKTNVLNYTIWMTRLDTANVVRIPSPTTSETVITNPNLPGLELHLPAGTVITDRFGKVVHEIGITAIPIEQPPFPLPGGVRVPIYFTVQPGGAYIKVLNPGTGPKGGRLIYPNAFNLSPGTGFDFWNYDADVKGWFIYGHGKVSPNARQVIPDPGVVIYEFTGAMVGSGGAATKQGCPANWKNLWGLLSCPSAGDPVSLATGEFVYDKADLVLADTIPINFSRTHLSDDSFSRSFGIGATDSYDVFLVGDTAPYTFQELVLPDGGRVRFDRISAGTDFGDAVYVHASAQDAFYGATLVWNGANWTIKMKDGSSMVFPEAFGVTNPFCEAVIQITDRYGNTVHIDRTAKSTAPTGCNLAKITSPNGRFITFVTDSQGRITQAQDNSGRTVKYAYDPVGRLSTVTNVGNGVTTYTYDDQNRMLTIKDARGIVYLTNQYDSAGRVILQTSADNGTYRFNWTPTSNTSQVHIFEAGIGFTGSAQILVLSGCWGANGFSRSRSGCQTGYKPLVAQVDVTDPRGYVRRVTFSPTGYMTSDTHALGQPEAQTVTYQYFPDNLLQSTTDPLGHVTTYSYDAFGNVTSLTRLSGTPNAVTTNFTYEPQFQHLASVTDPLGHTTSQSYDSSGNLATATDALGHQSTFTYDSAGRMLTAADPFSNITRLAYSGGDGASITDPLGNVTTQSVDALGRVTSVTDALGQITRSQYDVLNQVSQITDPAQNVSFFTYDPNGNPLTITDTRHNITTYTYDNMDRRATRTDPLLRNDSFTYDKNGNPASVTDRKGQVTAFTYDGLNRVTNVCFNQVINGGITTCDSTIGYQYDLPNRRTIITDSLSGVITRTFDDMGRLVSETTPKGTVSYGYDAASRLTTMTVAGQPQVTYTYDAANRLTTISKGSQFVQFGYDAGSRRSSVTLANGVVASYSYDNASRLTGISYQFGSNVLGNLTYTYDALGRRTGVGGSLARTTLPPVWNATYDAANQLVNWNGAAISYDPNGRLVSDGPNTYTWDSRHQLAGISGAVTAAFSYDAAGRRVSKTIGAQNTGFFYNGGAIAQELNGSTVTANLWNGGSSYFQRSDASGNVVPLVDGMGSVLALADSSGNLSTQYSYDPFGGTVASGSASGNPSQYINAENDSTGLYYMHARYYSPGMHRFVSEDPLGFAGGSFNLHAYSFNAPTNYKDPSGRSPCAVVGLGAAIGYTSYQIYNELAGRYSTYGPGWGGAWNGVKHTVEWGLGGTAACQLAMAGAGAIGGLSEGLIELDIGTGTKVTEEGLDTVIAHLEAIGEGEGIAAPEQAMVDLLTEAQQSSNFVYGTLENFYQHELFESGIMEEMGLPYSPNEFVAFAHELTVDALGKSSVELFTQGVVESLPRYLGSAYRAFWGIH